MSVYHVYYLIDSFACVYQVQTTHRQVIKRVCRESIVSQALFQIISKTELLYAAVPAIRIF